MLALHERIEAAISACATSLDMMAGRTGGRVSIGAVSTAKYFVPFAIAAFSRLHPKIDISLSIGNREEIRQALRGYDLDFAIMGRPPPEVEVDTHLIGDHPHHVRRFARLWFESSNRKPCSFIWLCESIDLDPSYVRKRVFQIAEESRPASSPERARVNDHVVSARGGYHDFPPRRPPTALRARAPRCRPRPLPRRGRGKVRPRDRA